jgi:hypothetical protein
MAWLTLIIGAILLGIGITGQVFGTSKVRISHPHDRRARRWVMTVGSVVIGLWLVAFSAAHLIHLSRVGRW